MKKKINIKKILREKRPLAKLIVHGWMPDSEHDLGWVSYAKIRDCDDCVFIRILNKELEVIKVGHKLLKLENGKTFEVFGWELAT